MLSGEGVLGLSSAFLSAGIPAVVATLWPVDDQVTRRLMRGFYAELAAGRSIAEALALAQRAVRDEPDTRHPFFWSGFVVIGDGDIRLPLARRWRPSPALVAAGALLFLGLLVGIVHRRRRAVRRSP